MANLSMQQLVDQLQTVNARWQVHPLFQLQDAVPQFSLGAIADGIPNASDAAPVDLKTVLQILPANPFLRQRRVALDILPQASSGPMAAAATPMEAGGPRPASVDWRNRWGWPWLTNIKDQGGCQACWCFGATGVLEATTRIEHAVWSLRSEGDVHDGMGMKCANGNWPSNALDWMKGNGGEADPGCWPYHQDDAPYNPTPDRNGRSVRLADYVTMGDTNDQKTWLDAVGPITACFQVYDDFFAYGSGVYHPTSANYVGNHCVVVVGFDDALGAWIVRNSWGTGWGMSGYGYIAYGVCNIDGWAKYGVHQTNPDPWTKRRLHNGNLIESGNGAAHRNFEMLANFGNEVRHFWRDGGDFTWHTGPTFGNDCAACPTLTGTTFGRNFESVHLTGTSQLHHWFFDQGSSTWNDGGVFGPIDADGVPGFIQSDYGAPGNFEVVVRTKDGKLNHFWRINGAPWTWNDGGRFGDNVMMSGPTLVQRRDHGLDVVAVLTDGTMQLFGRDDANGFTWSAQDVFGQNVFSPPCMIEGQYGAMDETRQGNYELCVAVGGQVQHWWRDNQSGAKTWSMSATFGHDVSAVAGLVEGSFGFNLETIVLTSSGQLQHYWRDGAGWHEGPVIGSIMMTQLSAVTAAQAIIDKGTLVASPGAGAATAANLVVGG